MLEHPATPIQMHSNYKCANVGFFKTLVYLDGDISN